MVPLNVSLSLSEQIKTSKRQSQRHYKS